MAGPPPPPQRPAPRSLKPWGDEDPIAADESFEAHAATEIGPSSGADALDFLKLPGASGAAAPRPLGGRAPAPARAAAPPPPPPVFDPAPDVTPTEAPRASVSRPSLSASSLAASAPSWRRLNPVSIAVGGAGVIALGVGIFLATRTPPPPPAPPPAPAFAFVSSEPRGARVLVNGTLKILETPAVLRLPAGPASLQFEKEGFQPIIMAVSGVPGEARMVDQKLVSLTPAPAPVPEPSPSPPPTTEAATGTMAVEAAPTKPKHRKSSHSKKKRSRSKRHRR